MLTKEQLIAAGYKPFIQRNLKEFTNSFYQKRFDDENGKKYFITVAEYDNSKYQHLHNLPEFSYQPDSQLVSNGITFNVDMLNPESIQQMEELFEKMWYNLGCEYYELFDY